MSRRAWGFAAGALLVIAAGGCTAAGAKPDPEVDFAWANRPAAVARQDAVPLAAAAAGELPLPESPPPRRQSDGGKSQQLLSLDLRDADVRDVLRMLADVGGVGLVASEDVQGTVTIRLPDQPWMQAFAAVASALHLVWRRDGEVIRVATPEKLQQEQERRVKLQTSTAELAELTTIAIPLRFAHAVKMADLLGGRAEQAGGGQRRGLLSERGTVLAEPTTNTLIVRDTDEAVTRVRDITGQLDIAAPQVLIESSIVEISSDLSRSLGVEWGYRQGDEGEGSLPLIVDLPAAVLPGSGSVFGFTLGSVDSSRAFDLRLTALERDGKARIVSRPRVVTLNNMPATIKSLTVIRVKLPSTDTVVNTAGGSTGGSSTATERIETGVILVVTPQVSADGQIQL
ncbi:MAG TPA: secretin N-terminal domain-containing protein, partial [Terriglobales bacterium]|nr:secretin N-terminal domain-containing protein [Terriglobales bacterium]